MEHDYGDTKAKEEIYRLARAHVRQLGDPVLRTVALPVTNFDEKLASEIAKMSFLMQATAGVGLAATQVGIVHRTLVYRADSQSITQVLINPVIQDISEKTEESSEGCLSFPGINVLVERAITVQIQAQDITGEEIKVDAEGFEARVIQHEIDHLNGVIILDKTSPEQRKQAYLQLAAEK
jgi:peptide deformylase